MIPLIVAAVAVLMIAAELACPGRTWPKVAHWWLRAAALNSIQIGSVYLAGVAWEPWILRYRPWSWESLGVTGGALAGYIVHSFIYYWWHRWRHKPAFLCRWLHQVHHSPQRIEIITSFYKHPFEILVNGVLSSAVLYLLCGLSPKAASYAFLLSGLAELLYHWNVRTPHWLGYFIQRPESHCIHHESGVHAYNYGDLPIFDILFGTFRNPKTWQAECGFGPRGEARLGEMLCGVEVSDPLAQGVKG